MVIADMMDIKNILKDFSRLAEARKNHTFRTRLVFIFCAATIAMVLFFSYRVVNSAMDKILVVNEGGELLRFKAMQQDLLQMLANSLTYAHNIWYDCAAPNSKDEACGYFKAQSAGQSNEPGLTRRSC